MRIVQPYLLLLIPAAAAVLFMLARRRSAGRPWLHAAVRLAVVSAVVLAMAGIEVRRGGFSFLRVFLLDVSESTALDAPAALAQIGEAAKEMDRRDRLAVIAFAREASVEAEPASPRSFRPGELKSAVVRSGTNIEAGLSLARSMFGAGAAGQVVVVSDGNETAGSAAKESLLLAAAGVPVYCLPVGRAADGFRLSVASCPQSARPGEPFALTLRIEGAGEAAVSVRTDEGRSWGGSLAVNGSALWRADALLDGPGLHRIEASAAAPGGDAGRAGSALAAVWVQGQASLLWVCPTQSALAGAAEASGWDVSRIAPGQVPGPQQLQAFDAIVLEDSPRWMLPPGSMEAIREAVRSLGAGLVMLGGGDSFGPGGFIDTPIEEALPVDCDPEEEKSKPVALALVIDHSGSMDEKVAGRSKLSYAQEGVLHAVDQLKAEDRVALVAFRGTAELAASLGTYPADELRRIVLSLVVGGTTNLNPPLQAALEQLSAAPAEAVRHAVLLSDGLSQTHVDVASWAERMSAAKISVSVVATGDQADRRLLQGLAAGTGGRFYSVDEIQKVPEVFKLEARPTRTTLVRTSPDGFGVRLGPSSLTAGLGEPPPAASYVLVKAKDDAEVAATIDDGKPLLATRRFGAGRSAAVAAPAGIFGDWADAGAFWAQVLNAVARPAGGAFTGVSVRRGTVRVEVADDSPEPKDYRAAILDPDGRAFEIALQQQAPDLYAGERRVEPAAYPAVLAVSVIEQTAQGPVLRDRAAAALARSPEWERLGPDRELLQQLCDATGGRMLGSLAELPAASGTGSDAWANASWLPAVLALLLFLFELAWR